MKKFLFSLLALGMASVASADSKVVIPDSTGFKFTDVKVIPSTPVKNQDKSGTCWCYSTNTFFENEILRITGKQVHLSEGFVVWHCYYDKAIKYIRMDGKINFAQGGAAEDVPYVWRNYGMVPFEAYSGMTYDDKTFKHAEVFNAMKSYVDVVNQVPLKKLSPAWLDAFKGILDAYMGKLPETFTYEGKEYTPQTFAASLGVDPNNYISVSSFTHHPFYEPFALEVADNWLWSKYQNVPLDELVEIADYALEHGYSIAWGADVSEKGMQWRKGYAILPDIKDTPDAAGTDMARWAQLTTADREKEKWTIKGPMKEIEVTQESRQKGFDNKETTDDHGMVIVGIAKDQEGNKYYKVQNSWDTNQLYNGFFYVSEAYFKAKTMNLYLHKDGIPAAIAKKIGIKK